MCFEELDAFSGSKQQTMQQLPLPNKPLHLFLRLALLWWQCSRLSPLLECLFNLLLWCLDLLLKALHLRALSGSALGTG